MTPTPKLVAFAIVGGLAYLGLAILGRGGFAAFFSHAALTALAIVLFVLSAVALFSGGNLSPGEREDRSNLCFPKIPSGLGVAPSGRIIARSPTMFALLHSLAMFVIDFFKSPRRLQAENLFLRHQLSIALRRAPPRLRLRGSDRALMVWLTRSGAGNRGSGQGAKDRSRVARSYPTDEQGK